MEEQLELSAAVEILEIQDLNALTESDLKKVKRRAQRRWHPDRIAHSNPSEEQIKKFERNFVLIDDALEVVRAYLSGEAAPAPKKQAETEDFETPEDIARDNVFENQKIFAQYWDRARGSSFEVQYEDAVLAEGLTLGEMLDEDLADDVPMTALMSLWVGLVVYFVFGLGLMLVGLVSQQLAGILLVVLTLAWMTHALASFVVLVPMARFWLPEVVLEKVGYMIDLSMRTLYHYEHHDWAIWVFGIPSMLVMATKWVIIWPIYKLVGLLGGDRKFGRVVVNTKYHAGLSEAYCEHLATSDPHGMSLEEMCDLAYASNAFREA